MAADYSKACDHDNIEKRPFARTWICLDCGADVPEQGSLSSDLGAVRLPTYDEMMRDARQANWRTVDTAPLAAHPAGGKPVVTRTIYAARRRFSDGLWTTVRVRKGCSLPHRVSHWSEDLLGLPACKD